MTDFEEGWAREPRKLGFIFQDPFVFKHKFPPFDSKTGIMPRLIDVDGVVGLYIEISDEAESEALRVAIPTIMEWKSHLMTLRSPVSRRGDVFLRSALILLQDSAPKEWSNARIAERLNIGIINKVKEILRFVVELSEVRTADEEANQRWIAADQSRFDGFTARHELAAMLGRLGYKPAAQISMYEDVAQAFKLGLKPVPPITPTQLRDKLRSWKKTKAHTQLLRNRPTIDACLEAVAELDS